MHFDGLIFDLDGTLWDCSQASADAVNLAYTNFGLSSRVTRELIRSISGKPTTECDEILLADVPTPIRQELSRNLDELEIIAVGKHAPSALYPDVKAGLELLKTHYKLFLVSNCSERYLDVFRNCSGLGSLFSDSECFGRTRRLKDLNLRAIVERQKLMSTCYIGDTAGDEDSAAKANLPFFHAAYGFGKPIGKPLAFANFVEITKYFLNLARAENASMD